MAYASTTHVQELAAAGGTITGSSRPNLTQVGDWLEQTGAVLDGILQGLGYTLPVPTGATSALRLLEGYNAKGAWALLEAARPNPQNPLAKVAAAAWTEAQKMLQGGIVVPLGLEKDVVERGMRSWQGTPTPIFFRSPCDQQF